MRTESWTAGRSGLEVRMYSREKIELFLLATEEVPRVAEPDGVPQEAWIRVGAVQEIVRTPYLTLFHRNLESVRYNASPQIKLIR